MSCDLHNTLTTQVLHDMEDDEMSAYFSGLTTPKVLVISVSRPSRVSQNLTC